MDESGGAGERHAGGDGDGECGHAGDGERGDEPGETERHAGPELPECDVRGDADAGECDGGQGADE